VTLPALTGPTRGSSDPRLSRVVESLDEFVADDPDYSFQLCAYHADELCSTHGEFAATVTGLEGAPALFDVDTIDVISQQQVHGYDEVLGQADRAHSIIFQKPTKSMPFGGHRAFGHDGAAGAFASADPDAGLAFAYTVARGPWPGGADSRAIAIAAELGRTLTA
jgi:CubicO group peptidase (beta-lactamase class C family)